MKNLRKVLAVVLAIALAFSMMAVASAKQVADYTDASTVKYTEAVDLISGLGIMQGGGGTTFDPTASFTREEAAKVITYMLVGTTVANTLTTTTSSFSDVAASRWSAPYIQYCANAGIINGRGDGTFGPEASITGTTFAKLLLTALGYGAKGEFVGTNWELNTLVKAQALGILTTGVNYTAPATRQEVAEYAFNALIANPVAYNTVLGTYSNTLTNADTQKITLGWSTFALYKTNVLDTYAGALSHYWKAYLTTTPVVVSSKYSDDTVLFTNTMGAPFSYSNAIAPASGFYKVGLEANPTNAAINPNVSFFVNGVLQTGTTAVNAAIALTSEAGVTVKYIDNTTPTNSTTGANVAGSNGLADIVYITNPTVAMLNVAPVVDAAGNVTLSTTAAALNAAPYPTGTLNYPAAMAAGDYFTFVKWNGAGDQNTYILKATKVAGQITAANTISGTMTFGGTTYTMASPAIGADAYTAAANAAAQNVPATGWVDNNGYLIIADTNVAATYNVGLVVNYYYSATNTVAGPTAQVLLAKNDGTVSAYTVAADATGVVPNQQTSFPSSAPYGTMVSYSFNGAGQVTVWPVADASSGVLGASGTVSNYTAQTSLVNTSAGSYYINASTKVYYFNGANPYAPSATPANGVAVQTGFGNTLVITSSTNVTFVKDPLNPAILDAIYFSTTAPIGTSGNYAYLTMATYSLRVVAGVNYYDYSAYVNGAKAPTTLTSVGAPVTVWPIPSQTQAPVSGLFSYTVDANGNVTGATAVTPTPATNHSFKVTYADASMIGYLDTTNGTTGTSYAVTVDTNTKYFQVNPNTQSVTAAPILASVPGGTTTNITNYVLNTNVAGNPVLYVYYTVQ